MDSDSKLPRKTKKATAKVASKKVASKSGEAAKRAAKTVAKKSATKATKDTPAKTVKKAAAKTAKKVTKQAAKKTTKTTAKKAARKSAKKAAAPRTRKTAAKVAKTPPAETDIQNLPVSEESLSMPVDRDMDRHTEIEASKYALNLPTKGKPVEHGPRDLPLFYGDTRLTLLVRDPEWIFAYWEINEETRRFFGIDDSNDPRQLLIRWYDITGQPPHLLETAHRIFDVTVAGHSVSWYQRMPEPNRSWCAELGIYTDEGTFAPICRSQVVHTPRNEPTALIAEAEAWCAAEEIRLLRLYQASGGRARPSGFSSLDLAIAQEKRNKPD